MVVSWGSLLVSGCSPFDSNMLVFAGDNAQCLHETYNVLNCWLCWSLTELLLGTFLDVDPFGSPIQRAGPGGRQVAGGWKAVLACHKGDEAYLQKAYNMVTTWNSESVCWRCGASKGANTELVYTTHGPNAPHRETPHGMHSIQKYGELDPIIADAHCKCMLHVLLHWIPKAAGHCGLHRAGLP